MNHSRVPAHEVLGTRSTAKPTANTNKATTIITTKVFIDRVIPTSAPLHPPLDQRGRSCLEGQVVDRVADPSSKRRTGGCPAPSHGVLLPCDVCSILL